VKKHILILAVIFITNLFFANLSFAGYNAAQMREYRAKQAAARIAAARKAQIEELAKKSRKVADIEEEIAVKEDDIETRKEEITRQVKKGEITAEEGTKQKSEADKEYKDFEKEKSAEKEEAKKEAIKDITNGVTTKAEIEAQAREAEAEHKNARKKRESNWSKRRKKEAKEQKEREKKEAEAREKEELEKGSRPKGGETAEEMAERIAKSLKDAQKQMDEIGRNAGGIPGGNGTKAGRGKAPSPNDVSDVMQQETFSLMGGMSPEKWWEMNKIFFEKSLQKYRRIAGIQTDTTTSSKGDEANAPPVLSTDDLEKALKNFKLVREIEGHLFRFLIENYYKAKQKATSNDSEIRVYKFSLNNLKNHFPLSGSNKISEASYPKRILNVLMKKLNHRQSMLIKGNWQEAQRLAFEDILYRRLQYEKLKKDSDKKTPEKLELPFLARSTAVEAISYLKYMQIRNNKYLQGGAFCPKNNLNKIINPLRNKLIYLMVEMGPDIIPLIDKALLEYRLEYRAPISLMAPDCQIIKYNIINALAPHRLYIHKAFEKDMLKLKKLIKRGFVPAK